MTNNELIDFIDNELKRKNIPLDYKLQFKVNINGNTYSNISETSDYKSLAEFYNSCYNDTKPENNIFLQINILNAKGQFEHCCLDLSNK